MQCHVCYGLANMRLSVSLVWCPGHVDIQDDEEAVQTVARHTADSLEVDTILPYDAKIAATTTIVNVLQQAYNSLQYTSCSEAEHR